MQQVDTAKVRREFMRWVILLTLQNARPYGTFEAVLLTTMHGVYPDATKEEIRLQLDYLESRKLIELDKKPDGRWWADLTRYGVDIVEYTIPCEPGIARPEKYW